MTHSLLVLTWHAAVLYVQVLGCLAARFSEEAIRGRYPALHARLTSAQWMMGKNKTNTVSVRRMRRSVVSGQWVDVLAATCIAGGRLLDGLVRIIVSRGKHSHGQLLQPIRVRAAKINTQMALDMNGPHVHETNYSD